MALQIKISKQYRDFKPRTQRNAAKLTIALFEHAGTSTHSAQAATLPFVINHCEENRIAYTLKAVPGEGYVITKGTE